MNAADTIYDLLDIDGNDCVTPDEFLFLECNKQLRKDLNKIFDQKRFEALAGFLPGRGPRPWRANNFLSTLSHQTGMGKHWTELTARDMKVSDEKAAILHRSSVRKTQFPLPNDLHKLRPSKASDGEEDPLWMKQTLHEI